MSTTTTDGNAASTSAGGHEGQAPPPADRPLGFALVALTGTLLALAMIALGVVALRDDAVRLGLGSDQTQWTGWFVDKAQVLVPADWMLWAGPLAVLLGLLFIVTGLRPRPQRYRQVSDHVWVATAHTERLEAGQTNQPAQPDAAPQAAHQQEAS